MLSCWSVELLECWAVGVLGCWSVGLLECWAVGTFLIHLVIQISLKLQIKDYSLSKGVLRQLKKLY